MMNALERVVELAQVADELVEELGVWRELPFMLLLRLLKEWRDVLLDEGELLGGQLLLQEARRRVWCLYHCSNQS